MKQIHHKADCLKDQGGQLVVAVLVLRFILHPITSFEVLREEMTEGIPCPGRNTTRLLVYLNRPVFYIIYSVKYLIATMMNDGIPVLSCIHVVNVRWSRDPTDTSHPYETGHTDRFQRIRLNKTEAGARRTPLNVVISKEKTLCVMIATGFHRVRTMDFQFPSDLDPSHCPDVPISLFDGGCQRVHGDELLLPCGHVSEGHGAVGELLGSHDDRIPRPDG